MTDIFTKQKRSEIMSKIKNKDSVAELMLRRTLYRNNIRFRIHNSKIFGKPDISVSKYRLAIFVDGDWWHGRHFAKENEKYSVFWSKKIQGNMDRDKTVNEKLRSENWAILRFWQKDIERDPDGPALKIKEFIEEKRHKSVCSEIDN